MISLKINVSPPYEAHIGAGLIGRAGELCALLRPPCRALIVTDDIVAGLYLEALTRSLEGAGFEASAVIVPHGERHKDHDTLMTIYGALVQNGILRTDIVIALGGGVVCDMAGFAAATYMRGIPCVMAPTTLLAQADSAVGGKTAINLSTGKNLVGAFAQPALVLADTDALLSLPPRQLSNGMAEVIKCAALNGAEAFSSLETDGTEALVAMSLDVKRRYVECDERDTGERHALNFGHTLGHAIERASNFSLLHGEAVAMGMSAITHFSEDEGISERGTAEKLDAAIVRAGLRLRPRINVSRKDICDALAFDKKRGGDGIDAVFLERIGRPVIRRVPEEKLADAIRWML